MKCEKCDKEHDGSFGSGRFCCKSCANTRVHSEKTKQKIRNSMLNRVKKDNRKKIIEKRYCKCGKKLSNNNKSGFCKECKSPKKTGVEKTTAFRRKRKKDLIEYKGGKCEICGYSKCNRSLDFHHLDPSKKEYGLSSCNCRSWERDKAEVDKCILVCANCHMEIHEEIYINGAVTQLVE